MFRMIAIWNCHANLSTTTTSWRVFSLGADDVLSFSGPSSQGSKGMREVECPTCTVHLQVQYDRPCFSSHLLMFVSIPGKLFRFCQTQEYTVRVDEFYTEFDFAG